MQNLHFLFINGEEIVYDVDVAGEKEGNIIRFSHDGCKYVFRVEPFLFRRDSEDGTFFMPYKREEKRAAFILTNYDGVMPIALDEFAYKSEDEVHTIKYSLESDEGVIKTIVLTLK